MCLALDFTHHTTESTSKGLHLEFCFFLLLFFLETGKSWVLAVDLAALWASERERKRERARRSQWRESKKSTFMLKHSSWFSFLTAPSEFPYFFLPRLGANRYIYPFYLSSFPALLDYIQRQERRGSSVWVFRPYSILLLHTPSFLTHEFIYIFRMYRRIVPATCKLYPHSIFRLVVPHKQNTFSLTNFISLLYHLVHFHSCVCVCVQEQTLFICDTQT